MLSVKQGGIKYRFWVFGMTQPGIEPRSPRPLANTLTARPMSGSLIIIRSKIIIIKNRNGKKRQQYGYFKQETGVLHMKNMDLGLDK